MPLFTRCQNITNLSNYKFLSQQSHYSSSIKTPLEIEKHLESLYSVTFPHPFLTQNREKMKMICIPVQLNDECTMAWLSKVGRGFSPDKSLLELVGFDADMEVSSAGICTMRVVCTCTSATTNIVNNIIF